MQVTLNIDIANHWDDLFQIIKKHDIPFRIDDEKKISEENPKLTLSKEEREKNWEILMKGVKFDDFDKFMEDFEEYRKDPPRPYRD